MGKTRAKIISVLIIFFIIFLTQPVDCFSEGKEVVIVGVVSVLTGDLGVLGHNIVDTVETYKKHYLRHNVKFVYEDAKLSSRDGLNAYKKLISVDKVDLIIGGCTSNGTMAAKALINSSRTPTITVVTGGINIDKAGPYIFRIGNSDTLNGYQEADYFIKDGIKRAALVSEETQYTQDISNAFRERFEKKKGTLAYDQNFLPGENDFRSHITAILKSDPQGIFIPTQTGTALGIFVKQWNQMGGKDIPIHTTFVAAPNPDAHKIAGDLIEGVYYMAPNYAKDSDEVALFFDLYKEDHKKFPPIGFHSAGTVDTLNLLQDYLDSSNKYSREDFKNFLLNEVKNYSGLMGAFSFDEMGNADLGFSLARIGSEDKENMR